MKIERAEFYIPFIAKFDVLETRNLSLIESLSRGSFLVTLAVAARDRKSYTIGAVKSRAKSRGGAYKPRLLLGSENFDHSEKFAGKCFFYMHNFLIIVCESICVQYTQDFLGFFYFLDFLYCPDFLYFLGFSNFLDFSDFLDFLDILDFLDFTDLVY